MNPVPVPLSDRVGRQEDGDRAPRLRVIDLDAAAERSRALLEGLGASPSPLEMAVVRDPELGATLLAVAHRDRDRRRAAADRLHQRLPDQLVESDPRPLDELLACRDVYLDLDRFVDSEPVG